MNQVFQHNVLLDRIRQGDNQAVKELHKMAFIYCTTFIIKNQGTQEDAKEVFQESMIILLQKLEDSNFKINCNVRSFLYSICRNLWLSERRKRGKMTPIIDEEGKEIVMIDDTRELEEKIEQENKLVHIFDKLKEASEECQKIIELTFFKKLSTQEIASSMDYSLSFVKNKRSRCIKGLRKKLGLI